MRRTTGYVTTDGTFFEVHREQEARDHETQIRLTELCSDILPENVFHETSSQQLAHVLFSNRERLLRVLSGTEDPKYASTTEPGA
jgi:hypothetical protein